MGDVVSPIGSLFGIGDNQGDYAKASTGNKALQQLEGRNSASGDFDAAKFRQLYANGSMTSDQALEQALNASYASDPGRLSQMQQDFATDPLSGSKYASEQVQNNPILGQLFGNGGALSRANSEEQRLAGQGFQLQPEDHEAYGQASGNIARMFGQQEQSLAQSLASRGLSQGDSGAAAVNFSGLAGNKNEQLAKAQTDIAQKRMQNTTDRLAQTRTFLSQMGSQGENAINNQYNRQLAGANQTQSNLQRAAGLNIENNKANNVANAAEEAAKQAAKGKTIGDAIAGGLYSGTEQGISNGISSGGGKAPQNAGGGGTPKPSGSTGQLSGYNYGGQGNIFGTGGGY